MERLPSIEPLIDRVRQLNQSAGIDFVFAELTVGLTRCKIARGRHALGISTRHVLQQAEWALLTANQLMQRFRNVHPDFDQMTALAERLRMELDALKPLRIPQPKRQVRNSN